MMNIAMPSIVIKMMRHKFDQRWAVRKSHASENEPARFLTRLRGASFQMDAKPEGLQLSVGDLFSTQRRKPGDL